MYSQREVQGVEAVHPALPIPVLAWPVPAPVLVHAQEVVLPAAPRNWTITLALNPERKAALWETPAQPAGPHAEPRHLLLPQIPTSLIPAL